MAVEAEGARDERAVAAERARRLGAVAADQQRAQARLQAAAAEQQRRNQRGEGTPVEEVLTGRDRSLTREFLHFMRRAYDDDGRDRFELAATLPLARGSGRDTVRGFLIGCAGEEPGDSGWVKSSRGLYLCEDGRLRTYRRPDSPVGPGEDLPPAEGVPIHPATGAYVDIIPGYFTEATAPRRRHVKPVDGKEPPLPPGVESASGLYRDGGSKNYFQSHNVHLFRPQTLEESLGATAHYAITEEAPRPMYDRYSPNI
jgi:hypothetical protein